MLRKVAISVLFVALALSAAAQHIDHERGASSVRRNTAAAAARDSVAWDIGIDSVYVMGLSMRTIKGPYYSIARPEMSLLRNNITLTFADVMQTLPGVFIKSSGRSSLSTVSFRGTAPSHTQVLWNGMKLNSPMSGQVDFSMVPSFFIDKFSTYSGASSVGIAAGGLGGAVALDAEAPGRLGELHRRKIELEYIQGVGSFCSFDEFLRLSFQNRKWSAKTRVLLSTSKNNFRYRNYNTKKLVTDADGNIIGRYNPLERNRNGAYTDFQIMQDLWHTTSRGNRLSFSAWYTDSDRGIAMLTSDTRNKKNKQYEKTLRAVGSWERMENDLKLNVRAGYTYTNMRYVQRALGDQGSLASQTMVDARSRIHSLFARGEAQYAIDYKWLFDAQLTAYQHLLRSTDRSVVNSEGALADTLNRQQRFELSAFASARWRPASRLTLTAQMRWELYGDQVTPPIPALVVEEVLSRRGNVVFRASGTHNYRPPTLNDLYFRPGGNKNLRPEKGWSYDAGLSSQFGDYSWHTYLSSTFFDSYIDDWILWMNDGSKAGIFTPINIKRVHSYGVETRLKSYYDTHSGWRFDVDGNFTWTRSINQGRKFSPADRSVGKQLIYIPVYSSSVLAKVTYREWSLSYKWTWYSERYTMSDNNRGVLGVVKPYLMSDVSLEKIVNLRWAKLSLKGFVYNLLNEEYETISSQPMPRMNFSINIGITPTFLSYGR